MIRMQDRLLEPEERIAAAAARVSAIRGAVPGPDTPPEGPVPTRLDWLFRLVDDAEDDFQCRRLRRLRAVLAALVPALALAGAASLLLVAA